MRWLIALALMLGLGVLIIAATARLTTEGFVWVDCRNECRDQSTRRRQECETSFQNTVAVLRTYVPAEAKYRECTRLSDMEQVDCMAECPLPVWMPLANQAQNVSTPERGREGNGAEN